MTRRAGWCVYVAIIVTFFFTFFTFSAGSALGQTVADPAPVQQDPAGHDHMHMDLNATGWHFMQDGVVYGLFNHQGGARGDDEFIVPNWWMGMWARKFGRQQLTLTSMLSLDRATVGRSGYAEIFQAGETLDGRPLIDRQHPHDFFMQLAGAWRIPLDDVAGLTIAGGAAGEPALGPVAFMHRPSAAENPTAPLGHHTLDSTHITYGVVTAGVDRGPVTVEVSFFNAREPDENRWDLDLGPLDSIAARVWIRPAAAWAFQVSSGRLREPEALEPGDLTRTTVSGSWMRKQNEGFTAVGAGYGVNRKQDGTHSSFFGEVTWRAAANAVYGRFERHEPEAVLLTEGQSPSPGEDPGTVLALTIGGVRDFFAHRGFELGLGADVTVYGVPTMLEAAYGSPVSAHVFLRLRLGTRSAGL